MALGDLVKPDPLQQNAPRNPAIMAALAPTPAVPPAMGPLPAFSSLPAMPHLSPIVTSPRQQQEQALQAKINSFENPGAPKQGFWHKLGRIAATAGNVAGDVLAPATMALIPGTQLNAEMQHGRNVRELAGLQGEDTAEQAAASENMLKGAQTDEATARAEALRNPPQKPEPKKWTQVTIPGQGVFNVDPETHEAYPITVGGKALIPPEATPKETTPPHITVMGHDGQAHIMERDPQSGQYSIDRGIAPPNYGQEVLPSKTITAMVNGVPTILQYNPATQSYTRPAGVSASGAAGHEMFQAGAVARDAETLISDLQANRDKLGTLSTWVQKYGLNTPIADPTLAGLQSELSTFAALQPAMHGFRSHSALETFDKIIGGLQKNPDATIAAIRSIVKTAESLNPTLPKTEGGAPGGPSVGTVEGGYRFKGGDPSKAESWEKVK